jgi:hypothetical protein
MVNEIMGAPFDRRMTRHPTAQERVFPAGGGDGWPTHFRDQTKMAAEAAIPMCFVETSTPLR